ncbi:MAG: hypothetical protein LBH36_01660 [Candidatus Nomurabacteria bacterium]|jgi:hypothetical protein|nr:hypothetical protein [Candidatus Nomurabacteria bacterium]
MTNKAHKVAGRIVALLVLFAVCVGFGAIYLNRQYISDYVRYRSFTPTSEIAQIAVRVGLTDDGRFRAYSAEPGIYKADEFNQFCGAAETEVNVLGCYTNDKIYIYDVSNAEISGIKEVTLVHEMLHADYARLGGGDLEAVNNALDGYAKQHADSLRGHMANYSAEDRYTELYSVLGTEYSGLPEHLETRYSKLFNRDAVLELYEGYIKKFNDIKERANEIVEEGNALATDITNQSAAYSEAVNQLNSEIDVLNGQIESGNITRVEFENRQAAITAEVNRLSALRTEIEQKIERYNSLVAELEQLELQSKKLDDSINSKLGEPNKY